MPGVDGNQITFSPGTVTQKTLPADALKLEDDDDDAGDDDEDDEDDDDDDDDGGDDCSHQNADCQLISCQQN